MASIGWICGILKHMHQILDGKKLAEEIRAGLKAEVEALARKGRRPGLTVVLVGNDPASAVYVRNKERAAREVRIESQVLRLAEDISQAELEEKVIELNKNEKIHGILVQLPLPASLDARRIIELIDPKKDVDCFHPENVGRLALGAPHFLPCTPAGILELLRAADVPVEGKEAVIVGRSNIVGKPLALMLINAGATVTVAHSRTKNLAEVCRRADILVSATGRAGLIGEEMVKDGAVVIDVGINRDADGRLVGDVDYVRVCDKTSCITPVPGGVGPMTIAMLLRNTVMAAAGNFKG